MPAAAAAAPAASAPTAARPRVHVARAIFPETLARLSAVFDVTHNQSDVPPTPEALRAAAADCEGLLTTAAERVDAALLDACPKLRIVANMAVGTNNLDLPLLKARGVVASNTPDVLTETTADMAFALLLAAARRVCEGERFLRAGRWTQWSYDMLLGAEVHGRTLGILGMGRIGQAIARRGHLGFNMPVIYHNRSPLPDAEAGPLGARWVALDALLRESDHLVLTVPYSAAVHHIIDAGALAQMKPGATLVNIGRGGLVDEPALCDALREGRLAAAGLDVFEGEPQVLPALLELPNVALTPHIGSASGPTRRAMADLAADNLLAVLRGQAALTPV